MRNIRIITLAAAVFFSGMRAFGQATEASMMIDNVNRSTVTITIAQPDNITQDALQQRLDRSGLKDKPKSGVMNFKEVILADISPEKIDLYTKVEKGPNNTSIVSIAVSKGYNNFANSTTDSTIVQNEKTFLESLIKEANDRFADVGISNQINDVNKDQKAYQKLLDEQGDLRKKKTKIDNRLADIQTQLDQMTVGLDKKRSDVDSARIRRSNMPAQ